MSRTVTENQLASLTKQPIMLSDFLEDRDAYLRMEKELLHKHHGEFVAIYDGKLIATDSDKLRLIQRVRKELGDERVFIQKVGESTLKIRLPQSRKLNIDRSVPEQK